MEVFLNNYRRMHEKLRPYIREELSRLLSFEKDEDLFRYQLKNEQILGKRLTRHNFVGLSSGTAALQFALEGIRKDQEVITTPLSYIATALSITNSMAKPVFVDVDERTMLMDLDKVHLNDKTFAVLPVHLYGQMVDVRRLSRLKVKIIEDACQAHMARFSSYAPGDLTYAACYSFFPNKNIGGISNSGMLVSRHKSLIEKARVLRNPTSDDPLLLKSRRTPAYLNWIELAFIKTKLKYIKRWVKRRREIAKIYDEEFANVPIKTPYTDKGAYHVYRNYVIRCKRRDKLKRFLKRKKIETMIHYEKPVHLSRTFQYLGHKRGDFPVAEKICKTALSIPINPLMDEDEIEYVVKNVKKFF